MLRCRTVYPRVCGGTRILSTSVDNTCGLSPRVRGNLCQPGLATRRQGSIPACAGEPSGMGKPMPGHRVYPRVCGGTCRYAGQCRQGVGLSPRVRGNLSHYPYLITYHRSIPACAGEPAKPLGNRKLSGVYPRVCGGTAQADLEIGKEEGLSPRVRGNRESREQGALRYGSIPACAGEPYCWICIRRRATVYPRVCGGTAASKTCRATKAGLSPRVRGNLGWRPLQCTA